MSDSTFYLGSELDRAVNRLDFFRLYKALIQNYEYRYFLLSAIAIDDRVISVNQAHSLVSLPDGYSPLRTSSVEWDTDPDPIIVQSRRMTAPFSMDVPQQGSDLIKVDGCETVTVVPLHTANARRFCLMMFGASGKPSREKLALIAIDAALVFQRYDETIISLDAINGLSDRELQIVRWTSEGKTSAEIAIILELSTHTVNTYIAIALRKLGVVNRAQMVASALRSGLIN